VIECGPGLTQFSAPWRVELPQGGVIRGSGQDAQSRIWPAATADQPSNRRIVQLGETGAGMVAEDNGKMLDDLNNAAPIAPPGGAPGTGGAAAGGGGAGATTGGVAPRPSGGAAPTGGTSTTTTGGSKPNETAEPNLDGDSGCSVHPGRSNAQGGLAALLGLAALGGLLRRRRNGS
jgi:MYXO-CTERM domain-containing protein